MKTSGAVLKWVFPTLTGLYSVLVFLGWIFDVNEIASFNEQLPTMKVNTALGILGISIMLLLKRRINSKYRILGASIIILLPILTLLQYFVGPIGIDNFLISDKYTVQDQYNYPGRMSYGTATGLLFLITLFLLSTISRKWKNLLAFISYSILVFSLISIIQYILVTPIESRLPFIQSMSIGTSISIFLLGLSVSYEYRTIHWKVFLGKLDGAFSFRNIYPLVFVIILLSASTLNYYLRSGEITVQTSFVILTVISLIITLSLIINNSLKLNRDQFESNRIESKIKALNFELSKSLKEKNILLNEVHHRVKNNMQYLISLIRIKELSKSQTFDTKEFINKIYSFSLAHELLHQSNDLSSIDLGQYISDLTSQLQIGYPNEKIYCTSENIRVELDFAISFGLIINELMTNSVKYAFKDIDNPEIRINIMMLDNILEFHYSDNGCGFDDTTTTKSTGTILINEFVKKFRGSIERFNESGSKYMITLYPNG